MTHLSQRATETNCENGSQKDEQIQSLLESMSKSDRYLTASNQMTLGEMFTGHDGPVTMNVYWSAPSLLVIGLADQWEVLSLLIISKIDRYFI